MTRAQLSYFGAAILLVLFCQRIWSLGTTHHDDAVWRLAAHQGNLDIISSFGISQGRIWAYVSGSLLYVGCLLQGTTAGAVLHVGAFATFFVAFHAVLSVYFNARVALLAAVLNLSLFALRWEGSIITSYPLFSWTLASVFVLSVHLGWRYARTGHAIHHWLSLPLLFVSMNIHEGVSVLFGLLAILTAAANHLMTPADKSLWARLTERRCAYQVLSTTGVVALYFGSYVAYRLVHPSQYDGNRLGSLNPTTILPVLMGLSTNGWVLADLFHPYSVNYSDAIAQDGYLVVYKPLNYLRSLNYNAAALVTAAMVALQVLLLVARSGVGNTPVAHMNRARFWLCLGVSAAIGILPVLPVALVGKYQEHYYKLNITSYAFTPLCHFGWSLALAAVLCQIYRHRSYVRGNAALALVASALGVLGYCSSLKNDAIASDMRRETVRWDVVDQIAKVIPSLHRPISAIHAPRLQNGSWFTVMDSAYWTEYAKTVHGQSLEFQNRGIVDASIPAGLAYVDYTTARDNAQSVVFAAVLDVDPSTHQVFAGEIAVCAASPDPSDAAEYLLSYQDIYQGQVVRRFSQLALATDDKHGVRTLRDIHAIPSTVRIGREKDAPLLRYECAQQVPLNVPILFGTKGEKMDERIGLHWLTKGWHPPEPIGVWSNENKAIVRIPLGETWQQDVSITIFACTYTGHGYADVPQTVSVVVGDKVLASKTFTRSCGWQPITFDVPKRESVAAHELEVTLAIDKVLNPAAQGLTPDPRNLAVQLQKLIVEPKTPAPAAVIGTAPVTTGAIER
jgi:hypothetical protein